MTKFAVVYNNFLDNYVTDDLYVELTPADTRKDLYNLLTKAIPGFEFPRKKLDAYHQIEKIIPIEEKTEEDFVIFEEPSDHFCLVDGSYFESDLSKEEINILSILMCIGWLQRQITSIENTRLKYSGSDFKFTSQANHLAKLITLQTNLERQSLHLQRLYRRRTRTKKGKIKSNWGVLNTSAINDSDYEE